MFALWKKSYDQPQFSSVQSLSHVWLFAQTPACQASLSIPPCPFPTPGACSNSCLLSQWCHPTISSSVVPFSCLQSFPESGSFPRSQFFTSGGQSVGASALASVLPMNIQDWFPLGLTGLISLQSKGLSNGIGNDIQYPRINLNRKEYMYNWVTFLYSRKDHNIVNQLYSNKNKETNK